MVDPIETRLETLEKLGKQDLIDIFSEWKPRKAANKKKKAPIDQRVSISITTKERSDLTNEIARIKRLGTPVSISQYVRNRALASIDIQEWRAIAVEALAEIEETKENQSSIRKERHRIELILEDDLDAEDIMRYESELGAIEKKLSKLTAQRVQRSFRLTGRMTMMESETVKWRAERLCLSYSDLLRMALFDLKPNSFGDCHLSYDAKRRFYISIIDVADHGWGEPPNIYQCQNCEQTNEENELLRKRIAVLEAKLKTNGTK